jgi:UDP-N-acetylmuramyl pentapeptide phosphotransferase/UDP-N-acetylglucosamine-1-phosphate transferase
VPASLVPLLALAALVSATIAAIVARFGRRWLADPPGRHRSHAAPTPRGAGAGIAVAVLLVLGMLALDAAPRVDAWVLSLALALVAAIGLLDDWRGLAVAPRLLVHALAAVLVVAATLDRVWSPALLPLAWAWPLTALAVLWCINLHNFMDGSNGLLALQAAFVFGVLAVLAAHAGQPDLTLLAGAAAAATLAFLPFNFPVARAFLGDVGSGALGLLVAALLLRAMRSGTLSLAGAVALPSVFVVDATLTLLARALRGKRWYARHREHLYQWLIRSGRSHARVALLYFGFNLMVVLPVVLLTRVLGAVARSALVATLLAAEIGLWLGVKRRILASLRNGTP